MLACVKPITAFSDFTSAVSSDPNSLFNIFDSELNILCSAAQGAWIVTCSDEDLVKQANEWTIEGKDLISEVTCKEPYEWKETTDEEWEFSDPAKTSKAEPSFHVSHSFLTRSFNGTTKRPD